MCFECANDEWDQVIGWYSGNKSQYFRKFKWGNTLDTNFTITDGHGHSATCRIRYYQKDHELVFPTEGEHYLFIGNYAIFHDDDNIELTARNPHEMCPDPSKLKYLFIKVDELIAEDYVTGFDRILHATNGTQICPDDNPEDQQSLMIEEYLKLFLSGAKIPTYK